MAYTEHDGEKRHAPPANGANSSWYPWTHTSATRTPIDNGAAGGSACAKFAERGIKFQLEIRKYDRGDLSTRDHDDVECADRRTIGFTRTKDFANPPLGAIAKHRAAESSRGHNPQAIHAACVRQGQQGQMAAGDTAPMFLHGDKLCA